MNLVFNENYTISFSPICLQSKKESRKSSLTSELHRNARNAFQLVTTIVILLGLFPVFNTANGQSFVNGFVFKLSPYDSTTQAFLPRFNNAPIEDNQFVSVNSSGHFAVNGKTIKFWGVNYSDGTPFISKTESPLIIGRIKKMGYNLARFHLIDNNNSYGTESIFYPGQSTRIINETNRDKMEYAIYLMKKNGIYVNVNLLAGRPFNKSDGIADADSLIAGAKIISLFDPKIISLQKEYARQILTHVNPYTGLSLVNDPVMAMVEICNENWLMLSWNSGLKPISSGGELTTRHSNMLDSLWNDYLVKKFGTTEALSLAWSSGSTGSELINEGGLEGTNIFQNWVIEQTGNAKATMEYSTNSNSGTQSATVNVSVTGLDYNVQLKQTTLSVVKDSTYKVVFSAKSDVDRTVEAYVGRNDSPWTYYGGSTIKLHNYWQTFTFTFTAPETKSGNVKFALDLGEFVSQYWFDDISVKTVYKDGLLEGESLSSRNIRRMDIYGIEQYSTNRTMSLCDFYITLQNSYYDNMYSFLKDTLGVKIPVSGSNYHFGLPDWEVQSRLDYVDNHAYWDHPSNDYFNNTSLLKNAESQSNTIPGLFVGPPVKNKPYTISEYNHPWPNRYQLEALFFLTGYGAFQDADALMTFGYTEVANFTDDIIYSPFDICKNNSLMIMMPSFAKAYRDNMISPASNTIELSFSSEDVRRSPLSEYSWYMKPEMPYNMCLNHRVMSGSFTSDTDFNAGSLPTAPTSPYITDNNEIEWNINGLLTINTPKFQGAVGFLNQFSNKSIGNIKVLSADNFGGFTWISLTDKALSVSDTSLLTISTRQVNTNMVWNDANTLITNKGNPPTLIEPIDISFQLNLEADSIRITPLDVKGAPTSNTWVVKPVQLNTFNVTLNQNNMNYLWFAIEKIHKTSTDIRTESSDPELIFYPNPVHNTLFVESPFNKLSILSLNGDLLLQREDNTGNGIDSIDVSKLPVGFHILVIEYNNKKMAKKIIKY
jgi:hypothetical protein